MDKGYFNSGVYLFNNYRIETKGFLDYISGVYNLNTTYKGVTYQGEFDVKIIIDTSKRINIPIVQLPNLDVPFGFEHIYKDKTCCLGLNYEVELAWGESRTFENFLLKILEPFLINLISYRKTKKCIVGEHLHAIDGVKEYYMQFFLNSSSSNILSILNYCRNKINKNDFVKGHNMCPCGSGLTIRKCTHFKELTAFVNEINKKSNLKDAFCKDMKNIKGDKDER